MTADEREDGLGPSNTLYVWDPDKLFLSVAG